jgi:hypothetical protein
MVNHPAPSDAQPELLAVQTVEIIGGGGSRRYDARTLASRFRNVGAGIYALFVEPVP